MVKQILIGSLIIIASILIHAGFISSAIAVLKRRGKNFGKSTKRPGANTVLIFTVIWVLVAHSASIWLWSFTFLAFGVFDGLEPALYFSLIAFTTLGFGDIVLSEDWRILSGFTAVNGLLVFGFSTAFMFEVFSRIRSSEK